MSSNVLYLYKYIVVYLQRGTYNNILNVAFRCNNPRAAKPIFSPCHVFTVLSKKILKKCGEASKHPKPQATIV